ncbi:MAG: tripartite tricarboxylate transporter TctB family protein [Hyphomicrobiaceae bacterium]|nr:tripartite tricarboxylate transporter TctB family protein [Hyphomicrobiaceae bacterium]MCC0022912.1 tripartite tricarboxylate transporter TctB family protein [Hyphomicrobiaceae bacterium]
MSDRIFGVVGILLSALFIWRATVIQESFMSDAVGPKTFPIIIGTILGLASLYFIARPDAEPVWPRFTGLIEIFMAIVVLIAYAIALPELGFAITTAIATAYLSWRLGSPAWQALLAGLLTSGGLYLVFRVILGLSLARGPFGF